MSFSYDPDKNRYRDESTGRFLSKDNVSELAKASIEETGNIVDRLGPAEMRSVLRDEVKSETIRQYLLGRGGENQMTPKDWGSVGGIVKEQYSHLNDFAAQLNDMSDAEMKARSWMYINSAREGLERGKREAANNSEEMNQERWVLGGNNPCDDCKELADMGWVDIGELGQFPGDGGTACLTNCECEIEYGSDGSSNAGTADNTDNVDNADNVDNTDNQDNADNTDNTDQADQAAQALVDEEIPAEDLGTEDSITSSQSEWRKALSDDEVEAIDFYTGAGYRNLNPVLRDGKFDELPPKYQALIERLDGSIKKAVVDEPIEVFRGLRSGKVVENFESMKGTLLNDNSFVSTSFNRAFSEKWISNSDNGILIELTVPKGTNGAAISKLLQNPEEHEFLLPRSTTIKILDAFVNDAGVRILRGIVVP